MTLKDRQMFPKLVTKAINTKEKTDKMDFCSCNGIIKE